MADQDTEIALIQQSLATIKEKMDAMDAKLERNYVNKDEIKVLENELSLIKKIIFGVVGAILIAVITNILNPIFHK